MLTIDTNGPLVFNIRKRHFHVVRNGDLVALANIVESMRQYNRCSGIKFHITKDAHYDMPHCKLFLDFMLENTDYFSDTIGPIDLPLARLHSVWFERRNIGDVLSIDIRRSKEPKICIFPVFDAPYNIARNWSIGLTQSLIDYYSGSDFDAYSKYFCVIKNNPDIDLKNFKISTEFQDNLEHILTCDTFIGGDTGTSHFASALLQRPRICRFLYPNTSGAEVYPLCGSKSEVEIL